jgi:hypothetical protein
MANGAMEQLNKRLDVIVEIPQIPDLKIPTQCYVLKDLPVSINLGTEFMNLHKVIINVSKGLLTIKDKVLEIYNDTKAQNNNELERIIIEKAMIVRNFHEKILKEVNDYLNENPNLD